MIKNFLVRGSMIGLMLSSLFFSTVPVSAVGLGVQAGETSGGPDLGIEYPGYSGLKNTDIRVTVARIIRVAMGLLGTIALGVILYAGFTWMTAGGNEEKVEEAKKWISAGVIGLAIILSAYAVTTFVINSLVNATTAGESTPIP